MTRSDVCFFIDQNLDARNHFIESVIVTNQLQRSTIDCMIKDLDSLIYDVSDAVENAYWLGHSDGTFDLPPNLDF